ncbi:bombyxin B-7-like [Macrosteles quadrilineatus]|uniref:bombyxin B-7-like n=1 Tax=Macrosteles quadrilineatus TaxID=74068 RepID=UPI0023E246B3|nr:bombyxin B-7-like [Macrosteles quadrilineatus]
MGMVILTAAILAVLCTHNSNSSSDLVQDFPRHWCGRYLVSALHQACKGVYQRYFRAFSVSDYSLGSRRLRRGVSEECCYKGCTIAVLKSYCTY